MVLFVPLLHILTKKALSHLFIVGICVVLCTRLKLLCVVVLFFLHSTSKCRRASCYYYTLHIVV